MNNQNFKKYIAEFVYGATDGTVTTFAIIAGVMGASLSPVIVIVLGVANLVADGFSMAASNYLSMQSEKAVSYDPNSKLPIKTALITFVSFVIVGSVPLLPFIVALFSSFVEANQFGWSILFTALAFLAIGAGRGFVTEENRFLTSLETLLIGGVAAVIAFGIGFLLKGVVGI
jgi:VIT1/CCC1 family predicted Fe2+/Mn2+ transporter